MPTKDKNGYWLDSKGKAIPPQFIDPVKKRQDKIASQLIRSATKLNEQIKKHKQLVIRKINELNELSKEKNGTNAVTENGYLTISNFRGTKKIEISSKDIIAFDSVLLNAAKEKFNNCIQNWSSNAPDELVLLVNGAFQLDPKTGKHNKSKILSLLSYNIKNELWKDAQDCLKSSISIELTKQHELFKVRLPGEKWNNIPLDYSKIEIK